MPTYEQLGFGQGATLTGDRARSVFGHVMGLVAFTFGFLALGAYIGRNWTGGTGIVFLIVEFAMIFGLQAAAARGHEQLATALLFGLGLFLGLGLAPILNYYVQANPGAVYEAAGATAIVSAGVGAFGYTTRRDLTGAMRIAFYGLIGLLILMLVGLFVAIPGENIIWCVLGMIIFPVLLAFEFQRLSRNPSYQSAVPIAAAIFLDILNIFLIMLSLFGGGGNNRR